MINSSRVESSPYANPRESHYAEILISSIAMTPRIYFHRVEREVPRSWAIEPLCNARSSRSAVDFSFAGFADHAMERPGSSERGTRMLSTSTNELLPRRACSSYREQRRQLALATSQCLPLALFLITLSPTSFFLPVHRADLWPRLSYS